MGFAKNLETVTDAKHQPAALGKTLHRFHDRCEARNGSGAQVIAISEAAGHDDSVAVFQIVRFVPEKRCRLLGDSRNHVVGIVITVRTGEYNNSVFHGWLGDAASRFQSSM